MKTMNKTALEVTEKMNISRSVMQSAHINYEQWINLMFDFGCLFAEKYAPSGWAICLLQNKAVGYWDWWLMQYMNDDKVLQYIGGITSPAIYKREKLNLLYSGEVKKEFNQLLSRIDEKL